MLVLRRRTFSPPRLAGLVAWYAADRLVGFSDADPIGTCLDGSANGNTLTASLTVRPTYKTNIQNRLPVMRFDSANDSLGASTNFMAAKTAGSVFFVWAPAVGSVRVLDRFDNDADTEYHPFTSGDIFDGFGSATRHQFTPSPALSADTFYVYSAFSGAADWRAYINGALAFSTGTNTVSFAAATPNLGGTAGNCDIGEFIVYDSVLSTANRNKVTHYLGSKWAVTVV